MITVHAGGRRLLWKGVAIGVEGGTIGPIAYPKCRFPHLMVGRLNTS
jgi:hypothetical protein